MRPTLEEIMIVCCLAGILGTCIMEFEIIQQQIRTDRIEVALKIQRDRVVYIDGNRIELTPKAIVVMP